MLISFRPSKLSAFRPSALVMLHWIKLRYRIRMMLTEITFSKSSKIMKSEVLDLNQYEVWSP